MGASKAPALHTRDLSVSIDHTKILHQVSLQVQGGEVVALLGHNGSGKSTFVKAVLGLLPFTGEAQLLGQEPGRAPWKYIGYVPQRLPAMTGIPATALEIVRAGGLHRGTWRRASAQASLAALDCMGLAKKAHDPVKHMSGGEQQRVLIARALVCAPKLLFLDEPTTGLDVDTTRALVEALNRLRAQGCAVVVVLHETEAFEDLLDRRVTLSHGQIVAQADAGRGHCHGEAGKREEESCLSS